MKGAQNENIPLQADTTLLWCVLTEQSAGLTVFADGRQVMYLRASGLVLPKYTHNYFTFYDLKIRKKLHFSSLASDS